MISDAPKILARHFHFMCLTTEQYQSATEPMISHLDVDASEDITIRDLAKLISEIVEFQGEITFDTDYPRSTIFARITWKKNLGNAV
jgi:hypothetical protein